MTRVRIIAAAIFVGLIVFLLLWGPAACQRIRSLTAQSRVNEGQSGAFHNSATDAVNTIGGVAANEAAGAETGRQNEEEIRHAKGADQRVDPAANAAGLRALCRRQSHRNDPACRMLEPHP